MTPDRGRPAPARRRVIVTADDFGRSLAINEAIERAHRAGILTTASLMVGGEAAADAVARARRLPGLRVGLHMAVIDARPVLPPAEIPALVGTDGAFGRNPVATGFAGSFRPEVRRQLAREIEAQFAAFAATGLELDHANAHKHMHLHPTIGRLLVEIGTPFGLRAVRVPSEPLGPLRQAEPGAGHAAAALLLAPWARLLRRRIRRAGLLTSERVFGIAWSGAFTEQRLLALLRHLPAGVSELYFHPALSPRPDAARGRPDHASAEELVALTSPKVRHLIADAGIELTSFSALCAGDPAGLGRMGVVLDTNVFVAAGFNPDSSAAQIVRAIEGRRLALVWNRAVRREIEAVVRRIPRLSWQRFAPLFEAGCEYGGAVEPERFGFVADPDDRKFAALAAASGAILITNDAHLLAHRGRGGLRVLKPAEFVGQGAGAWRGLRPEASAGRPAARSRQAPARPGSGR